MKLNSRSSTQQITFAAIIAALTVIFIMLANIIPFMFLSMIFVLPFFSALVYMNLDFKYYLIYFFGTILLTFVLNITNFDATLFSVIPNLLIGLLIAFLYKIKITFTYIPLFVTLLIVMNFYISLPLINFIYKADFFGQISRLFGENKSINIYEIVFCFVTVFALINATLISFIISEQNIIKQQNYSLNRNFDAPLIILLSLLGVGLDFVFSPVVFVIALIVIYLFINNIINLFTTNKNLFLFILSFALISLPFTSALTFIIHDRFAFSCVLVSVLLVEILRNLWLYIERRKYKND